MLHISKILDEYVYNCVLFCVKRDRFTHANVSFYAELIAEITFASTICVESTICVKRDIFVRKSVPFYAEQSVPFYAEQAEQAALLRRGDAFVYADESTMCGGPVARGD